MCVPHGLVGIIIGRRGATIKQLQNNLKVTMTVDSKKSREGTPNLHIQGPPANVQKAKDTILSKYQCKSVQNGCTRQGCKFIHPGRDAIYYPETKAAQPKNMERTRQEAVPMQKPKFQAENAILPNENQLVSSCHQILTQMSQLIQQLCAHPQTQSHERTSQIYVGQTSRNS
jgi:hypothetical protein